MWRRYGDAAYALFVLTIFTVQAIALGGLTWYFIRRRSGLIPGSDVLNAAALAVAVTAVSVLLVTAYVLTYQALSARRERKAEREKGTWEATWLGVLYEGEPAPPGPVPDEALDALLELGDRFTGSSAVVELLERYDAGTRLLAEAHPSDRHIRRRRVSGPGEVRFLSNPRRIAKRLDALEGLARGRMPFSFETLIKLTGDRELTVRVMAVRALARTMRAMRANEGGGKAIVDDFIRAVADADVPTGVVNEAFLVLEEAAAPVIRNVLRSRHPEAFLPAAMNAAGRLRIIEVTDELGSYVRDPDPELRAAAIRALAGVGYLPDRAAAGVEAALSDDVAFVRTNAARATVLLPPDVAIPRLKELLGDPIWWVRRASADALLRIGQDGAHTLHRAARRHPDRFARHMAIHVLVEGERLTPAEAHRLEATA